MPLVRFKIRNELSLGGPELNRSAAVEDEEPKAILGAVEVAGLIGILRQLGDLAEFSAEVFNGIQEEVTVTASRCQKLTSRVRRIESALSPLEKAVLSQTSHIHFAYTAGTEWHPRIRNGHSHFVQSDLPLCVMESYEQCRDPPPLHLLDRFAIGGPGSCLRKYSDPTFFRKELGNPSKADDIKVQRDQAHRKRKKKRLPQRNICRSNAVSTSDETNGAGLSSLTDDRQTTSQSTSTADMPHSSNMQDLSDIVDQSHLLEQSDSQEQSESQVQSDFQESSKPRDSIAGSGYIEYVINHSPVNKPEGKLVEKPADRIGSAVSEGCIEVVDDNILYSPSEDLHVPCASIVCDEKKEVDIVEKNSRDEEASETHESNFGPGTPDRIRQNQRDFDRTYILFDEVDIVEKQESKCQASNIDGTLGIENYGENKSEQGSEADEFVDARNTIESESESDIEGAPKPNLEHYFGDISTYCSEDANSDNNDGSEDTTYEQMAHDPRHDNSLDESCSGSYLPEDASVSCCLSDPVCGESLSHDENFQKPKEIFAMCPSLLAEETFPDEAILREEPIVTHPLLAGDCANDNMSSEDLISSHPLLKDAIPAEKILPLEHLASYPSLKEDVPHEKISPGESVAKYSSFAERTELSSEVWPRAVRDVQEIVPQENILPKKSLPKTPSLAEAVSDNMTPAEKPDAAHPSFPKAVQDKKISPEVLDSKHLSVPEAVSQEKISLEEFIGIYPYMGKSAPDEMFLTEEPEEPGTTCLSLTKAMPIEKLLPEKPLEEHHYLAELPKEKILQEKSVDSSHQSCAKAASEANLSLEVLDSTNLSVSEAVPQEKTSREEFVGINPCLEEAAPDERFLPEEPVTTYLSLTKAVAIEKVLPEELLETHPSLAKLPEEKILHEEAYDGTHPSEAVSDEGLLSVASPHQLTPEVSDSKNLSLEEALPQEQISLEEFVGINPCLEESVPDERFSPEEPVITCLSLKKDAAIEGVLPEKPLDMYPFLAKLADKKILLEEAEDATHPSLFEAVSDAQISPGVLDSTNLSVEEAVPQEQISLEEFVGIDPCLAEAVPEKRVLQEQPVTTCMSLTKAVSIEEVVPKEPLEAYASLERLPKDKILQEKSDDATHLSCVKAESDENVSQGLYSTNLSVAGAVPHEQIALQEFVGIDPCLPEAVPEKTVLLEEPVITCVSLTKAVPIEEVLPEEPLQAYASLEKLPKDKILQEKYDDATHPSCAKAERDENVSQEVLYSSKFSVEVAIPHEQIAFEEFVGIDPCLAEANPEIMVLQEEPVITCVSLTKVVPVEEVLPEEPLEAYASSEEFVGIDPCLGEAVLDEMVLPEELDTTCLSLTKAPPYETIFPEEVLEVYPSLEELTKEKSSQGEEHVDATHPSFSEAVGDEKILPLEGPSFTYPSLQESVLHLHEKTSHEELVGTNPFLELVVPKERGFTDEPGITYQSSDEAVSMENNLPEEPLPIYPSLAEAILDKKISLEEPDATCPPSAEAVFDEKISGSESPGSTIETDPHNKIFPKEPFATDIAFAEAVFDEKIPGSESPGSTIGIGPHNKIFPEEPVATDLSLAEADFDEKIAGSEAPGSTTKTGLHNKTFPEEPVAADLSLAEAVFDEKIPDSEAPSTTKTGLHNKTFPEEPVAADLSLAEAVFDEKIPGSEAPSTTKTGLHNKTFPEEPVAADLFLAEAVFDEKIPGSEAPSTTKTGLHNKTFPEEPVATDLSLAEAVFDEKIPGSEAPSTAKTGLHNETFPEEPVATDLSVAEAVFDEKIPGSEAPGSTTETGPHNNTLPEEPVPDDNILPKEPAAAYLALAEGIPDQKVFLDDAALLLFAEAIFDQKFSPEVPESKYPSLKEPEMPVTPPSLVTDLPAKNILVKEGKAYDEPYTASDVSKNQKSGLLEPKSAERTIPLGAGTVTISPDTQESPSNGTSVEPVSIWSNGGLLGLAPLKPPVFAEPDSVSKHIQNEINEASVLSTRKQESSSRSVEDTEKSSLPLVVSDPTSQQHSNMLSPSHLQSTGNSFRVFGLSHRLLMAGFRGNSSSTYKFESVPSSSDDTEVAAIEDKTQQIPGGSSVEEQLEYESSLFGSPSSSPPVEHMKISFNNKDASPVSKLKLRIPCQPQYNGNNVDMFHSFQLVPEASNSDDDDNSDTFCQSSPCVSDNCLSDSELWESDESPRKSISSMKQVEERRHGDTGSFSGSFLDLPCYDAVDHQSTSSRLKQGQEQEQVPEYKPSVLEIIRDWPPNQPKSSPSTEADANADEVMKRTQNQSLGLVATDDDGER